MNFIDSVVINSDNGTDEAKIESYKIVKHIEANEITDEDGRIEYEIISSDFSYDDLAVLKQLFDADKLIDTLVVVLTVTDSSTFTRKEVIHPYSFNFVDIHTPEADHSEFIIIMGFNSQSTSNVFVDFNSDIENVDVFVEYNSDIEDLQKRIREMENSQTVEVMYDASQDRLIDVKTGDPMEFGELYKALEEGVAVVVTASMGEDAPTIRTSNFYFGLTDSGDRFIAATTVVFADATTMVNTCVSFIETSDGYAKLADSQANTVTGSPVE